jgi:hypothetical protein
MSRADDLQPSGYEPPSLAGRTRTCNQRLSAVFRGQIRETHSHVLRLCDATKRVVPAHTPSWPLRIKARSTHTIWARPHLRQMASRLFERHSNESPPLSVSVSGKRDFARQRQLRRKGPSRSTDRRQRQSAPAKARQSGGICRRPDQFGAICMAPGKLSLNGTAWWGWEDSNF